MCILKSLTFFFAVKWLSHPPNTRKVASSTLAGKNFTVCFHGKRRLAVATGKAQKRKKKGAREVGSSICLKHVNHRNYRWFSLNIHRLYVGARTNEEKNYFGNWTL